MKVSFSSCLPGNGVFQQLPAMGIPHLFIYLFISLFLYIIIFGGFLNESHLHSDIRSSPSLHPPSPRCCARRSTLSPLWQQGAKVVVCNRERFNHLCDSAGFKQSRLLQAFPAVTNSEGKGERKLLGPAGFRQAGSRGNKRKPLTNHSIILILSEKRARDG